MKSRLLILAMAIFSVSSAAQALTLREAVTLALDHDPRMQAGQAGVAVSQAIRDEAAAGYRPSVVASVSAGRSTLRTTALFPTSGARWPNSESIDVSQPLYAGGGISAAADAAASGMDSARETLSDTAAHIVLSAIAAYLDVQRDRAVVGLSQADVQTLEKAYADTHLRTQAGEATHTDEAQAEARLAEAQAQLKSAIARQHVSEAAFRRLTGIAPDELVDGWPGPVIPASLQQALKLSAQAPAVRAAEADARAAKSRITVAGAAGRPQVTLDGSGGSQDNTEFGYDRVNEWSLQLKLAMPIYQGGMIRARVSEAQARADQAAALAEDLRRSYAESATQEWERLQAADEVIRAYESQERAAALALDGTRKELAVGTRTTLDLLNADRELLAAQVNVVSSKHDRALNAFQLLAVCGSLNPQAVP
ncbi:MAG TPA: TolC family outer membrane protein [Stenotrophobium sp.]|jgi:outer membrane protein|nr:TolC family outer membrane protein [Stenotrophobium sp.]